MDASIFKATNANQRGERLDRREGEHGVENGLTHDGLQEKARAAWDTLPDGLRLRMRRAMSWIERAEKETDDLDAQFIFYWIAFNAVYGQDTSNVSETTEQNVFNEYFDKIIRLDANDEVYEAIWQRFSGPIRNFMDNKYVYQPFWKHQNRVPRYEDWEDRFVWDKERLRRALARQDTKAILKALFNRLYVLRNQLLHGGATWQGSVNRDQVRDGARIIAFLTPIFIDLMMKNPRDNWGHPHYPRVNKADDVVLLRADDPHD